MAADMKMWLARGTPMNGARATAAIAADLAKNATRYQAPADAVALEDFGSVMEENTVRATEPALPPETPVAMAVGLVVSRRMGIASSVPPLDEISSAPVIYGAFAEEYQKLVDSLVPVDTKKPELS